MSEQELVPVFESVDVGQAEILRTILEESGIHCFIENENQAGLSGVLPCRLLVPASDSIAALAVIRDAEHQPADPVEG